MHGTMLAGRRAMRLTLPSCLLLVACASGSATPRGPTDADDAAPAAATALLAALRDSTSPSRVYLPREVAQPAEALDDFEKAFGATHTGVEPTVVIAVVRGVVDATGAVERRTLTLLPGSDPREGSILFQRATKTQWRPARLADGRAVRQLVEWRFCRADGNTCLANARQPMERTIPRVTR